MNGGEAGSEQISGGRMGTGDPEGYGEGDGGPDKQDIGFLASLGYAAQEIFSILGKTSVVASAIKDFYKGITVDRPAEIRSLMSKGMTAEQAIQDINRRAGANFAGTEGPWGKGEGDNPYQAPVNALTTNAPGPTVTTPEAPPPPIDYQNAWETYNRGVDFPGGGNQNAISQPNTGGNLANDVISKDVSQSNALSSTNNSGNVYQEIENVYQSSLKDITEAENQAEGVLKQALSTGRGDIDTALGQVNEAMQPYAEAGQAAIKSVMGMLESGAPSMEEFRNSRTYQFPLEEMTRNMQRAAAVKGKFLDPSTLNAINDRAQDYASQRWQQFRDEEYWRPMQANMDVATGLGLPAAGTMANASQWAGGTKAGMEMTTGNALAQNKQWGSGARSNLGQNYIGNRIQKGNQGINWYQAGEGQRERDWTENVGMPWAEQNQQIAMDWSSRQNKKNQQNTIWSDIIGAGANWLFGNK